MSVARLHALFAHACFGLDADAAFGADLAGYLASQGVDAEDREALLAGPRRLWLYRRLLRNNVVHVVEAMLERTKARVEAAAPGAFGRTIDAWLAEVGPRTPHLRDVPSELLAWAAPRWAADARLPPWIVDYAELELADFTVGVAARPAPPPPLAEVAADRPLVFGDPRRLVRLGWAVHEVPAGDVRAAPDKRDVAILVYRDGEHRTRFLELTPLAAAILEELFAGRPLAEAVGQACHASGALLDEAVLGGAAKLLADLGERGVLLGARAPRTLLRDDEKE
jgi:hypothetical protein